MISASSPSTQDISAIAEEVTEAHVFVHDVIQEIERVIVGQRPMIERLLIGLIAGGHVLLEGVPGLAKTLVVRTLARTASAGFQRIQFTPDLLPADLLGTLVYEQHTRSFSVKKGPIFSNLVLADEINRAPAKVQSALLEAMQERQVTIGEETFPLPSPFLVLATQNPIEHEGTYPLPEAQVDRFMLKVRVEYPTRTEELSIMRRMANTGSEPEVAAVVDPQAILRARAMLNRLYVDERIEGYIVDLIMATRDPAQHGLRDESALIAFGASPRATIALNRAARTHAFLDGRAYVTPEDVRSLAPDVLRHRLAITYEAEAEDVTSDDLVRRILAKINVP
jgi:MoxR-like ATPase